MYQMYIKITPSKKKKITPSNGSSENYVKWLVSQMFKTEVCYSTNIHCLLYVRHHSLMSSPIFLFRLLDLKNIFFKSISYKGMPLGKNLLKATKFFCIFNYGTTVFNKEQVKFIRQFKKNFAKNTTSTIYLIQLLLWIYFVVPWSNLFTC